MEPRIALAPAVWESRKFYQSRYDDSSLTCSRCDCPPSLNTFVNAVSTAVAGGAAFPTGQSLSSATPLTLNASAND